MKKVEDHIPPPSELLMIHQWQEMPDLFEDASWSVPAPEKPAGRALVFTSYCLN